MFIDILIYAHLIKLGKCKGGPILVDVIIYAHLFLLAKPKGVPKHLVVFIYARFSKIVIVHLALMCVYEDAKVSWNHTLQLIVHISAYQSKLAPLASLLLQFIVHISAFLSKLAPLFPLTHFFN